MMNTPRFWYPSKNPSTAEKLWPLILTPLSWIWRLGAWVNRITHRPYRSTSTVVVIGNINAGGTGKTPLVAAIAIAAAESGRAVFILSRGHGGAIQTPHLVQSDDSFRLVGDEAKWLSQFAPVVVAKTRRHGLAWIDEHVAKNGQNDALIVMDDGLQNPSIAPRIRIAVFNGKAGAGNGKVIPAGPLRQTLSSGLKTLDGVVISGNDECNLTAMVKDSGYDGEIYHTQRHFDDEAIQSLTMPVVAFAGIGHPQGFFDMLAEAGVNLVAKIAFADHHPFSFGEIATLKAQAVKHQAQLVTTEKDLMRIDPGLRSGIEAISLKTSVEPTLIDMILKTR